MLGIGLRYSRRSRSLGGRAAQHVEADPAGGPMVPRRQSASVAALFAVPRAATESANGGASDAGLRLADGSSRELSGRRQSLTALQRLRLRLRLLEKRRESRFRFGGA